MNEQPPAFPVPGNPPPNDGLAVASLCCGIGSVVCLGALSGVPAIICGHMARGKIARSGGTLGGAGLALAGLIMGYVSVVLTVIAVIFLMAAVSVPAFVGARMGAQKAMAATQCRSIQLALENYASEYGKYPAVPTDAAGEADNAAVVAVLRAQDTTLNPRGVAFFETRSTDIGGGQVLDPWKRPLHFSFGTGGKVEAGVEHGSGTTTVWSAGPNGINEKGGGDDVTPTGWAR
jgi:type II secretory pathway pseudopilin PulG